jgi:hypothetical protein
MVWHGSNGYVAVFGKVCILFVKYLFVDSGMGEFEVTRNAFEAAHG